MQKNSIQTLSKLAVPLKSKGRFFNEKKTHLRSDFQRDRDRIIPVSYTHLTLPTKEGV